ncbi:hypothetical protein EV401DRAFT_1862879, partial [Pisolithus croceorrhizus]
ARYQDLLPEPPCLVDPDPVPTSLPRVILHVFNSFQTGFNKFGIAHEYRHRPSYDLEHSISVHELSESTGNGSTVGSSDIQFKLPLWPWPNMSIWRLMAWQSMGSGEKSSAETTRLVHNVLLTEDFNLEDISEFNAETATRSMDRLEATLSSDSKSISQQDGWKTDVNVNIQVPSCEKCSEGKERVFMVCGLTYCPLISVVRAAFMEAALKQFHLTPFKHIWKSPVTGREQRLYNELYMSDIWIKAHDDVQKQCQEDSCTLK